MLPSLIMRLGRERPRLLDLVHAVKLDMLAFVYARDPGSRAGVGIADAAVIVPLMGSSAMAHTFKAAFYS